MEVTRDHILSLTVENESDIGVCRRKGVSLAKQIGFNEVKTEEIAILISELVTNVLKHGGGTGKIVICQIEDTEKQKAIEIWCCDSGSGITDLHKSMQDGITEKDSLGIGLGTIRRFSDEMEINPVSSSAFKDLYFSGSHDYKHCVRTLKWVPIKSWVGINKKLVVGAASRCYPGEQLNGDAFLVNNVSAHVCITAVIDGLGHGKEANLAAELVKENILLKSNLPLDSLMNHIHHAIKGTRGAVIGLARINTETNRLSFSGIGNIEGFILTKVEKKTLLSFGGIIGHNMRTPRVFESDFEPGDTLCMYSDGITSRWRAENFNWDEPPQKNAELILSTHSRLNDDATILIIRYTQ